MSTVAYWTERIVKTKALIVIYEDAILAVGTDGVQSYTLDTGQTRQTVTKLDISALNKILGGLYNRLVTLDARINGGSVQVVPAW